METLRRVALPLLVAPIVLALGCDAPSSPTTVPDGFEPSNSLVGNLLLDDDDSLLDPVTTLRRTEEVDEGTCARRVPIGPEGGVVSCPEAGLRLEFPKGALPRTTRISVHIPRGDLVGYEFSPHGLRFEKKVRLVQALEGTEAAKGGVLDDLLNGLLGKLVGAYVEDIDAVVAPLELFSTGLLGGSSDADDPEAVFFKIDHFSGYVCATS